MYFLSIGHATTTLASKEAAIKDVVCKIELEGQRDH